MSIDSRGSSPSRASQDRISALSSANQRLMAANKHAEAFVKEQAERYAAELSEVLDERDRARQWATAQEQQIDMIRADLVAFAGEVRGYIVDEGEYGQGHYQGAKYALSLLLERIGERYPDMSDEDAADALAKSFDSGPMQHASEKLPVALDLDDEARKEAGMEEIRNIAGYSNFGFSEPQVERFAEPEARS